MGIKKIKAIKNAFEKYRDFGISVGTWSFLNRIYKFGVHENDIAYKINVLKHKAIIKYLYNNYNSVIKKHKKEVNIPLIKNEDKPKIWTIWWQGEEKAPEICKLCFNSMRKYSNDHEVVVISEKNYDQYIQLPDYILEKVRLGKISFIHFADIIRMYLLNTYGGMWLDATILLTDFIPEYIFEYDYFTGKLPRERIACVSECRWNGTFFAGKKSNQFCNYMLDFYKEYWNKENQEIDYFLIDYMTLIAYESLPIFKKQLDDIPYNNVNIFKMVKYMNSKFDEDLYQNFVNGTSFHKMQRRSEYRKYNENGNKTFFGYFFDSLR